MKKLALVLASTLASTPAMAGVYVNVENNGTYSGKDYVGAVTDFHVGYEGKVNSFDYYVQGGPALVRPDGADAFEDTRISGKVGGSFAATEKLDVYGEISLVTAEADTSNDNTYGTKLGVKYSF